MYSSVPPPNKYPEEYISLDTIDCEGSCSEEILNIDKEKSDEKGLKNERWQRFQRLKERRKDIGDKLQESKKGKQKRHVHAKNVETDIEPRKQKKSEIFGENRCAWKELCQNIDVNSHLSEDNTAKEKPKSKLEEKLDEAIEEGDFTRAESISDEIAKQDLSVKIVGAVEVRDYKKRKEIEEHYHKRSKKKKLIWGFEQKERWESKGNM